LTVPARISISWLIPTSQSSAGESLRSCPLSRYCCASSPSSSGCEAIGRATMLSGWTLRGPWGPRSSRVISFNPILLASPWPQAASLRNTSPTGIATQVLGKPPGDSSAGALISITFTRTDGSSNSLTPSPSPSSRSLPSAGSSAGIVAGPNALPGAFAQPVATIFEPHPIVARNVALSHRTPNNKRQITTRLPSALRLRLEENSSKSDEHR
jgi:hypothetical protein